MISITTLSIPQFSSFKMTGCEIKTARCEMNSFRRHLEMTQMADYIPSHGVFQTANERAAVHIGWVRQFRTSLTELRCKLI